MPEPVIEVEEDEKGHGESYGTKWRNLGHWRAEQLKDLFSARIIHLFEVKKQRLQGFEMNNRTLRRVRHNDKNRKFSLFLP